MTHQDIAEQLDAIEAAQAAEFTAWRTAQNDRSDAARREVQSECGKIGHIFKMSDNAYTRVGFFSVKIRTCAVCGARGDKAGEVKE